MTMFERYRWNGQVYTCVWPPKPADEQIRRANECMQRIFDRAYEAQQADIRALDRNSERQMGNEQSLSRAPMAGVGLPR